STAATRTPSRMTPRPASSSSKSRSPSVAEDRRRGGPPVVAVASSGFSSTNGGGDTSAVAGAGAAGRRPISRSRLLARPLVPSESPGMHLLPPGLVNENFGCEDGGYRTGPSG